MRNQNKYLLIYLCVLCVLVGSAVQLAQADEQDSSFTEEANTEIEQAVLDQMLAPIALYPDTLLSHILVASTYPLEVIQAARWRKANENLEAQEALDYAETQDWDPSVQALAPFTDLLQTLSNDLQWLQQLGDAFLFNEEQVLASIQGLRQKAYALGNLSDNEYLDVDNQNNEIVILPVQKEIVYVPYYDTRVVYGNWWWHNRQPYRWHRPQHSVLVSGLYWSIGFHIRPSFYFGGFHWPTRHIFADYSYRRNSNKYWTHRESNVKNIRVKESQRWTHNTKHRRGVQYRQNGKQVVYVGADRYDRSRNIKGDINVIRNDKKRITKQDSYSKSEKLNTKRVKKALSTKEWSKNSAINKTSTKQVQRTNNKQRVATESNRPKSQKATDSKVKKIDRSGSQKTLINRNSQKSSTKYSYKANNTNSALKQTNRSVGTKSNQQSFKRQNQSRTVKANSQIRNQNKH